MFTLFTWFALIVACVACALASVAAVRVILGRRQSAGHRGLFGFSDGARVRYVDPIAIIVAMEAHPEYRFDLHPSRVADGEKEAIATTVDAVRNAFGIPKFSQVGKPGLTQRECLALFNAFCNFVGTQKKSTESTAT
jgi:hypothetical protein